MRVSTTVLLLLYFSFHAYAQPCPKYGTATNEKEKKLNIAKNQSVNVSSSEDPESFALNKLITTKKRKDENLFRNGAYVVTEGFLMSFEEEGAETCNCGKASKAKKNGDVHMYLALVKNAPKKNCIVIEITPAFKKIHPDYENLFKKNAKVRVTGYLLYDYKHEGNAVTTCTSWSDVWRKTCWEVHPITSLEILSP
jgi:hypothetical protein